jgi:hypothetical protein
MNMCPALRALFLQRWLIEERPVVHNLQPEWNPLPGSLDGVWYHYDTIATGAIHMANVLVRDLDDAVLKQLKVAAKAHGRSLQAEIHAVLENASVRSLAATRRVSGQWLKRLRMSSHTDSTRMIREDRDTR